MHIQLRKQHNKKARPGSMCIFMARSSHQWSNINPKYSIRWLKQAVQQQVSNYRKRSIGLLLKTTQPSKYDMNSNCFSAISLV